MTVILVKCPAGALPDEERLQCPDLSRWGLFLCSQGHILTDLGSHCYFAYILPCSKLAPRHSRQAARLESAHWGKRLTWGHLAVLFGAEWRRPGHRRVVDGDPRAHDRGHSGGLSIKSINPVVMRSEERGSGGCVESARGTKGVLSREEPRDWGHVGKGGWLLVGPVSCVVLGPNPQIRNFT